MSYMGFLFFYPCAPSAENYFSEIYLRLVLIILLNCNRNWTEKLIINFWFLCSEASTCEAVSSNLRQEMQNRPSCRPSRILSQALPGHFLDEHLAALMGRASQYVMAYMWDLPSLQPQRPSKHVSHNLLWSAPLLPWSLFNLETFTGCLSTPLRRAPRRVLGRI